MEISLSLKDSHLWTLDALKKQNAVSSNEEIVQRCVSSVLRSEDRDLVFGTVREQCGEGCFSAEPQFEIEIDRADFEELQKVYSAYGFQEYNSVDEEISKTIRCIIKYIESNNDFRLM